MQVESLLSASGVPTMCVPATYEAFPTWKGGLGFADMPKHQLAAAKTFRDLLMFPGTHMLSKALLPGQETLGLDEHGNPIEPGNPSAPQPSAQEINTDKIEPSGLQKKPALDEHGNPAEPGPSSAPENSGPGKAEPAGVEKIPSLVESGPPSIFQPDTRPANADAAQQLQHGEGLPAAMVVKEHGKGEGTGPCKAVGPDKGTAGIAEQQGQPARPTVSVAPPAVDGPDASEPHATPLESAACGATPTEPVPERHGRPDHEGCQPMPSCNGSCHKARPSSSSSHPDDLRCSAEAAQDPQAAAAADPMEAHDHSHAAPDAGTNPGDPVGPAAELGPMPSGGETQSSKPAEQPRHAARKKLKVSFPVQDGQPACSRDGGPEPAVDPQKAPAVDRAAPDDMSASEFASSSASGSNGPTRHQEQQPARATPSGGPDLREKHPESGLDHNSTSAGMQGPRDPQHRGHNPQQPCQSPRKQAGSNLERPDQPGSLPCLPQDNGKATELQLPLVC